MASVRKLRPEDPKSPWVVEYSDEDGKRRRETPKSGLKKDALAIKLRIENELKGGSHLARSRALTVAEVCERYLLHCEQRVHDGRITRASFANIERAVRITLIPGLGKKSFIDLRPSDVEDLYNDVVRSKKLTPQGARKRLGLLARVQNFAIKRDMTRKRVVEDVLRDLRGMPTEPIRRFTLEQTRAILLAAAQHRHRCHRRMTAMGNLIVHLGALCGMRYGEIAGLTCDSVDFEQAKLKIRHSYSAVDGHKKTKTAAGMRDFPMPTEIRSLLKAWMDQHYLDNERKLIFTTTGGGYLSNSAFHAYFWKPLLRRLNLVDGGKTFHFHALRHFAASMFCKHVPLTEVPALLGHSHVNTTLQIYAHEIAAPHIRAAAVEKIACELKSDLTPNATKTRLGASEPI